MTTPPEIRAAGPQDAPAMAALINRIIDIGGTTGFRDHFDVERIMAIFVAPPRFISCFVAESGGKLAGFQGLVWVDPDWPEPYCLPADWATIASYVDPDMHGRGVGSALMAATLEAAHNAGAAYVDATIRRENAGGLAYYGRMGFEDYAEIDEVIRKRRIPA
ncbi:MAG: GNAT family N-acetyltransferase [Pseudomonadota bacterium]